MNNTAEACMASVSEKEDIHAMGCWGGRGVGVGCVGVGEGEGGGGPSLMMHLRWSLCTL